jgi:hypothetical protein
MTEQSAINDTMTKYAKQTGIWSSRFAAVSALGGVLIIISALMAAGFVAEIAQFAVLYVAMGAVICFLAYILVRFSAKMRLASKAQSASALSEALAYERTYWQVSGAVTLLTLLVTFLAIAYPAARGAVIRSRDRRTLKDLQEVAAALEKYALTNHQYPKAAPLRDGRGREYDYVATCDNGRCSEYRIITPEKSENPDFILSNGHFVKQPAGTKP